MRGVLLVLVLLIILGVPACSGSTDPVPEPKATRPETKTVSDPASLADDAKLFEETCSKCHPTARPKGYKGSETWSAIVQRMINANKAPILPENASRIIAYLEKTYPRKGPS